jgi:hypothetical protein
MTADKYRILLLDTFGDGERIRLIHTHACQHCPSIHTLDDPYSLQIRDFATLEEKIESVFRCGWRGEKACRGYADFIGVTAEDLASIYLIPKNMP